ncbi:MAG TPA: hypothetical protein VIG24_06545 [Acidimicrobiia bacterium]
MDPIREIKKRIEEYKEQLSLHLMAGGARSHEDYCRTVGKAEAFEYILSDIKDIEKKYLDE